MTISASSLPGSLGREQIVALRDHAEEELRRANHLEDPSVRPDIELVQAWGEVRRVLTLLLQGVTSVDSISLQSQLEELGLPLAVRSDVAARLGDVRSGELDIETFHGFHLQQALGSFIYKGMGKAYLQRILADSCPDLSRDHARLVRLSREIGEGFNASTGTVNRFRHCGDLVYFLNGADIEATETLIHAMLRNHALGHRPVTTVEEGADDSDFDVLMRFLSVFSDVSQFVISAADTGQRDLVYAQSRAALVGILNHPNLHMVHSSRGSFFDLLQASFRDASLDQDGRLVGNPWFVGDLRNAPYDPRKIAGLVAPAFSRHSLGLLLAELNRFRTPAPGEGEVAKKPFPQDPVTWALLLHILNPDTIVQELEARRLFYKLLRELSAPLDPESQVDEGHDHPRVLLKDSLAAMLKDPEPNLDQVVPAPAKGRHSAAPPRSLPTMRSLLQDLARVHFDPEELRGILTPIRAEGLSVNPSTPLGPERLARHFNTARVGFVDLWAVRAGELLHNLKRGERQFDSIVDFLTQASRLLFGSDIEALPNTGAHNAWSDFCNSALRVEFEGDDFDVFTTTQEYPKMLEPLRGDRLNRISLTCGDGEGGRRSRSPEELIQAFKEVGAAEDSRGILFLSTHTRFGEVPCPEPGGLERFIELARTAFPQLRIILDGAQAVGRLAERPMADGYIISGGKAAHMGGCGAVLVSSTWLKELKSKGYRYNPSHINLERTAAMAFVLAAMTRPHDDFSVEGNVDPRLRDLPLAEKSAMRLQELTAYTLRKAHGYGKEFQTRYGHILVVPRIAVEGADDADPFGIEVVAPQHDQVGSYGGIVTLNFPSANAKRLIEGYERWNVHFAVEGLAARGFELHYEGYQDRLLSISLHPWHTEKDIDALFEAIMQVNAALLEQSQKAADFGAAGASRIYRYQPVARWPQGKQPF